MGSEYSSLAVPKETIQNGENEISQIIQDNLDSESDSFMDWCPITLPKSEEPFDLAPGQSQSDVQAVSQSTNWSCDWQSDVNWHWAEETDWSLYPDNCSESVEASTRSIPPRTDCQEGADMRTQMLPLGPTDHAYSCCTSLAGSPDNVEKSIETRRRVDIAQRKRVYTKNSDRHLGKRKQDFGACPFYKSDCQMHAKCLRYELRRPKDVRQHIYRKHSQLRLRCLRCTPRLDNTWDSGKNSYTYINLDDYHNESVETLRAPKVSDCQILKLKQYISGVKSPEDQWYDIWDILFPGENQPRSAYVGGYFEQPIERIRCCWAAQASSIIDKTTQEEIGRTVTDADRRWIDRIVASFLHEFEIDTTKGMDKSPNTESMYRVL
ncbi:hypothetical protein GQ53DRAFT_761270 [Thozetella sp. PMI_491]|nr:hypothetical protein GQ53DRAFT_761270 [Thozetella sp. PMI_491]